MILTNEERELLQLSVDLDLRDYELAEHLGITPGRMSQRMKRMHQALNAKTRHHLIFKAMILDLVEMPTVVEIPDGLDIDSQL